MAALTTLAIIGIGVAVAGTAYSVYSGQRAAKAQEQQNTLTQQARAKDQAIAENTNRQNQLQAIRRARQSSANTRQMAVNQGSATSTSASAAASSPFVQAGANIGFQNQQIGTMRERNTLLSQATMAGNSAVSWQQQGATGQAVAGVGKQMYAAG